VNAKCLKLLEQSLKAGRMVSLGEEYMNGFADMMAPHVKVVLRSQELKTQEERLATEINSGLQNVQMGSGSEASSQGQVVSVSETVSAKTGSNGIGRGQALKQSNGTGPQLGGNSKKKVSELGRPDSGMIYLSALNSKALFGALLENLDPSAITLWTLPDTRVRYFTIPKSSENTSPKVVFLLPEQDRFDAMALGAALVEQRLAVHRAAMEIKDKVKGWLVENVQEQRNAQIIFTGYGSGAQVAQLTAIRLMFDADLQLYRSRHRCISLVFGDVRLLSPTFISSIDAHGFDHRDHLSFCSTEAFLPSNVVQHGKINFVGKRLEFGLGALLEKHVERPVSLDLESTIIIRSPPHPLVKFLTWETFKMHSLIAYELYEVAQQEDKSAQMPNAIKTLQQHFKAYRLGKFPEIFVDCLPDPHGDEMGKAVPSSRLICNIKDTSTKAELQLFFRVFWTDDVHDINERFLDSLLAARKDACSYQMTKVKSTLKLPNSTGGSLNVKSSTAPGFRYRFVNWMQFFQGQLSESVTPQEAASRLINPFFDQSAYFELDEGKFKYSLSLSSEVLMRKLLSTNAADQKLVKTLFGPLDTKLMYRHLPEAKQLFRAPVSSLSDSQASLLSLIHDMFNTKDAEPTLGKFLRFETEQKWGDFKIRKVESMHMNAFTAGALELKDIYKFIESPGKARDCSHHLPAKQCPKVALLEVDSPFWERMFRFGDIYVAFRGSGLSYSVPTKVNNFCSTIQGRDYETIGSVVVLEIKSQTRSFGNTMVPQYTFYLMISQDPLHRV